MHHEVGAVQPFGGLREDPDLPPLGRLGNHRLLRFPLDDPLGVVLQVFAHTGGIHADLHPVLLQLLRRADAREHQQFGRIDGTGGDHDLFACVELVGLAEPVVDDGHTGAPVLLVEGQHLRAQPGQQVEVLPVGNRVDIGHRAGGAGSIGPAVNLEKVRTVGDGFVVVELRPRDARLFGGVQYCHTAGVRRGDVHQVDGPGISVVRGVRPRVLVGLQLFVQPEGGLGVPAGGPVLRLPFVQVLARRPEGNARVVAGAAAHHLGAGVAHERVAVLLLLDRVVPVVTGFEQFHPAVQLQDLVDSPVIGPGFDQGHLQGGILAESRGDRGARGSTADDDVVVGRTIQRLEISHLSTLLAQDRERVRRDRRTSR